jgi:hypothetical protein
MISLQSRNCELLEKVFRSGSVRFKSQSNKAAQGTG